MCGSATNSNVGGTYSFGEDALFGGSVSASFAQTDYTGTADDDTNTRNVSASLRFEPSPGLTVSPSARQTRYEVESGPSNITETTVLGVGVSAALNDVTTLNVNLNETTIDDTTDGVSQSIGGSAGVTLAAPNGSHSVTYSQDLASDGTRSALNYNRTIELAASEASYGLGIARGSNDSTTFTANATFSQEVRDGGLSLNLNRSYLTENDGDETLSTDFSASFSRQLTDSDGFDLSADISIDEPTSGTRSTDASASVAYNRNLTEDWNLRAGYEHRYSQDAGSAAIRSNAVFVKVDRSWISFR